VPSDDPLPEAEEPPWGHACAVAAAPGTEPEACLLPDSAVAAEEAGSDPGGSTEVDDGDNFEAEVRTCDAGTEDTCRRAEVPCSGRAGEDRNPGEVGIRSLSEEAGGIQEGPLHETDGGNIEEGPVVDSNGDGNVAGLEALGVL
jgi:hypothetical protein